MAKTYQNPDPAPQDNWRQSWDSRRNEIDREILGAFGQGRSVDEAFADVSQATSAWVNDDDLEPAEYSSRFREYYDSRLADLERGGALARQENGSFYVNPEYASGEGPAEPGSSDNRLAQAAVSSRSSAGSSDPAKDIFKEEQR